MTSTSCWYSSLCRSSELSLLYRNFYCCIFVLGGVVGSIRDNDIYECGFPVGGSPEARGCSVD